MDFPKHKHDYVEIFYCLSGSVTHVINEEEIRLRPGELLFMNQHIEHAVIACGQEDLGINIIIRPAYFQNILTLINKNNILADFIINALEGDSCVGQYLYFTVSDNPCIQNLIHNAVFLLLQQPQNWHKLSEHTFALLFMHILSNAENILLDQKDEQSNVLMVVVRRYLAEHYDTGTLHELAAQIDGIVLSDNSICNIFHLNMYMAMKDTVVGLNQSPVDYYHITYQTCVEE